MEIIKELKHHMPFTLSASILAVIIAVIIYFSKLQVSASAFEILHPAHIFVSAVVSSALYYKYKKNIFLAFLIGIISSVIVGSLSDIVLPYIGGTLLQIDISFHLPLIETPLIILASASIGTAIGMAAKFTKFPHFIHILVSTFASMFYLLAFTPSFNLFYLVASLVIVFIAVLIPCCISDIVFLLLFVRKR